MNLNCYKVLCIDDYGKTYEIGIMISDIEAAKNAAVNNIFECKHIKTTAVKAWECDSI